MKGRTPGARVDGIPGGPSFAYVFGWVLVMMIGVEAITGAALAAFYSPSAHCFPSPRRARQEPRASPPA